MSDRRKALEDEFFRNQNAELVAKLRANKAREEERRLMSEASGISDTAVLDHLLDEGLDAVTVAALSLVPLVAVAWADGKLDNKERDAVLAEAGKSGVSSGTPPYELLQGWLAQAPAPSLMTTWRTYAEGVAKSIDASERRQFRETIVARARAVAQAAGGGFAGLGSKISGVEADVIKSIEAALPD